MAMLANLAGKKQKQKQTNKQHPNKKKKQGKDGKIWHLVSFFPTMVSL